MKVRITNSRLTGEIEAIPSKSEAHRYLICSALADKSSRVFLPAISEDIEATIDCLSALGAEFIRKDEYYEIKPIGQQNLDEKVLLRCKESGSTLRFLLPIVAALGRNASFFPEGRLSQRPLSPLYEELERFGARLSEQGTVPFECSGKLKGGDYVLSGNISSQFISGLLFALPMLEGNSTIKLIDTVESRPYIDMTVSVIKQFGIKVEFSNNVFFIEGNQRYRTAGEYKIEGDWSNAAFWLCAGAIAPYGVTCNNLCIASQQGDKAIVDVLRRFGAEVETKEDRVSVCGGRLKGCLIDAKDIPDLIPVVAVVASVAEGRTVISNAERLRIKESDRLRAITIALSALGANIEEKQDGLIIEGKRQLAGGSVEAMGDHRIAMMAAIASLVCSDEVVIANAEAVNKSYPRFYEHFRRLGGNAAIE